MARFDSTPALRLDAGVRFDETPAPASVHLGRWKMTVILLALARKTVAQLLALGANLITNLTGNTNFTDATITAKMAELTAKATTLNTQQGELEALRTDLDAKEMQVHDTAA